MLFDLKVLQATLDQLEQEKKIPRTAILDAIEQALAAAYKKDYGKRGQVVRCTFNQETGDVEFYQVKFVEDTTTVKPALSDEEVASIKAGTLTLDEDPNDMRVRFNPEQHMYVEDARTMKADAKVGDEMIFPLEVKEDFGRIAAQTAKQVIIQRIREAERGSILGEYASMEGQIVNGVVQKFSRGAVFVDVGRATGMIAPNEKIPGEFYKTGQRIKAYLYAVEDGPQGVMLRLSRSHPRLIEALFAIESPEIASGAVEIKSIAREAGMRSKIAVMSNDPNIDPIGACVGQKGVRVSTVTSELSGEKIDVIPWSTEPSEFISNALSPARVLNVNIDEENHVAYVDVADDQLSLAIGKEGQNVRLAAKLTGWKIDIAGVQPEVVEGEELPIVETKDADIEEVVEEALEEAVTDDTVQNEIVEAVEETTEAISEESSEEKSE